MVWKEQLLRIAHRISVLAFWPALVVIVWGELTPQLPAEFSEINDKLEHFTAYAGLATMAVLALGLRPRLVPALLGIVALGGVLEILQGYTGRDPDFWDFVANSVGAGGGTVAGIIFLLALRPATLVGIHRGD